ncbi:SGNH/GDSL hydrolase family protein, partial [Pseudomonas sp. BGM005]|nr:SGNH/GDSL hydrolase family protein [Pseudomonas sp. BG5]
MAPAPLLLPDDPTVLVFGDSWTYGSAATVPTEGYAYVLADLLGGETIVNGVRGSGYLKPGIDGPAFGERIAALDPALTPDLIIMQGSINDREQGEAGYREAVTAAWDAMSATYPDATIVVLGPAPHELPVGAGTARIDTDLGELAAARGWWYISPIAQNWITEQNYLSVI